MKMKDGLLEYQYRCGQCGKYALKAREEGGCLCSGRGQGIPNEHGKWRDRLTVCPVGCVMPGSEENRGFTYGWRCGGCSCLVSRCRCPIAQWREDPPRSVDCPEGVVMPGAEEACGRNYKNKCREFDKVCSVP